MSGFLFLFGLLALLTPVFALGLDDADACERLRRLTLEQALLLSACATSGVCLMTASLLVPS